MKKRCLLSLFALLVAASALAQTTSDEMPPISCGDRLVAAVRCTGRYCDNITATCGGPSHQVLARIWMPYISEEGEAQMECVIPDVAQKSESRFGFVTGFRCTGDYCDNVSLQCAAFRDIHPDLGRCRWTDWISDETGTVFIPPNAGIVRMQCRGRYCDDMRFYYCAARP